MHVTSRFVCFLGPDYSGTPESLYTQESHLEMLSKLLLTLYLEVTSGSAWGTLWGARG